MNSQGYIETDIPIDHCVGTDLWHFYNGTVSLVAYNADVAGEQSDSTESHATNPGPPASCAG